MKRLAFVLLVAACSKDFEDYRGAAKSEAKIWLRRLGSQAKAAAIVKDKYPSGTAKLLPPGDCCKHEPDHKCAPVGDWPVDPVWKALDFEVLEATAYKFTYVGAPDGKTFHATAVGDPGCSGTAETWFVDGTIDADGNPHTTDPKRL